MRDSLCDVHSRRHLNNESLIGKRLGRFKLLEQIGRGSIGIVYRAVDIGLDRQVAVKVFSLADSGGNSVGRFLDEARATSKLLHPGIVIVHEVGEASGWPYIVMEWVEGSSLEAIVRSAPTLPIRKVCQIVADAGDALAFAHHNGLIHRDVKPGNLILNRDGRCKVVDFGLACCLDASEGERSRRVGTPAYVAPEIIRGEEAVPQSDIYSLACTLWFLLAGEPPFSAPATREMLRMHLYHPVPDLRSLRPELPDELVISIRKAMSKDPSNRHSQIADFARQIRLHSLPQTDTGADSLTWSALELSTSKHDDRAAPVISTINLPKGKTKWTMQTATLVSVGICIVLLIALLVRSIHLADSSSDVEIMAASESAPALALRSADVEPAAETRQSGQIAQPTHAPTRAPDSSVSVPVQQPPGKWQPYIPNIPGVLTLSDMDKIAQIAVQSPNEKQRFAGRVVRAFRNQNGTAVHIFFQPAQEKAVIYCVYFPKLFLEMAKRFGGEHGIGLEGKIIIVTGSIKLYRDTPQIVIDNPDQVSVLEADAKNN